MLLSVIAAVERSRAISQPQNSDRRITRVPSLRLTKAVLAVTSSKVRLTPLPETTQPSSEPGTPRIVRSSAIVNGNPRKALGPAASTITSAPGRALASSIAAGQEQRPSASAQVPSPGPASEPPIREDSTTNSAPPAVVASATETNNPTRNQQPKSMRPPAHTVSRSHGTSSAAPAPERPRRELAQPSQVKR